MLARVTQHPDCDGRTKVTSAFTQNTYLLSGLIAGQAQAKHLCFHGKWNCIQFDFATAVMAALSEHTRHKSAGRLFFIKH